MADCRSHGRRLLITHSAATHALKHRIGPLIPINGERGYRIGEERRFDTGARGFFKNIKESNHFGVNVALGGVGNLNPFSRQAVQADGALGHLYIDCNPKDAEQ